MASRAVRALALLAAALLLAPGPAGPATAAPTPREMSSDGVYVVALAADQQTAAAARRALRERVIRQVAGAPVLYRFTTALTGFAAELTGEQAKRLRSSPDVLMVERSTVSRLDSVDSPEFLGADRAWASVGGSEDAGRGTVVGVIDSGIWPENPAFSGVPEVGTSGPRGFEGACEVGEQWDRSDCNSKILSARYFVRGFGEDRLAGSEFLSPRDGTGHGSHIAAVAAGNHDIAVTVDDQRFGKASGMAPAARIAAYKACWTAPDPADDGCTSADLLAAVDRAVRDGVDVISLAASAPPGQESRALELALLNATAAGVFVAASAGNRGPGEGTVAHTSPWVTTVGASTHHLFQGAVLLDGEAPVVGAMVADDEVPSAGIVLAESAGLAAAGDARLCRPGSLDPRRVAGRIVVCDRGTIARVDKSEAVALAGGVGMVLANTRPDSVDPDFHAVPTVHLDVAAAEEVKRYVRETVDPRATLDPDATDDTRVPQVAPFSSRGPTAPEGGSILKPDLTAPGVGVLSAVAPPSSKGRLWGQWSGTSMSTAHVAGLGALVVGEHPRWTPAMVKSAMSTTAHDLAGSSSPLAVGAGQVDAEAALDPGLVLDASPRRFRAWWAGQVPARRLNLPSIAVGDMLGEARVVRRVRNVAGTTETYSARVEGLAGLGVRVRPRTMTLAPGETGRFVVLLDRGTAPLERATAGHLVWAGPRHEARLPVVVTPRTVSAPPEATGSGDSGSVSFEAVSGTSGELGVSVTGLAAASPIGVSLEPGGFDPAAPAAGPGATRFPLDVQPGTAAVRVELTGRDSDDMDLHLYREGELVASAAGSTADEILTELDPSPGQYELFVVSASASNGSTTTAQLYTWVVRDGDARNLRVPGDVPVSPGETFPVVLGWDDLSPTARWFGVVDYTGSDQHTFVTIN